MKRTKPNRNLEGRLRRLRMPQALTLVVRSPDWRPALSATVTGSVKTSGQESKKLEVVLEERGMK